MYESFYGLSHTPFSRDIPTNKLYLSSILEETLARLEYAAARQLFAVITGDCSTGKTTTIRRFAKTLDSAKYKILYLSDSKLTPRHFYKGMLEQHTFKQTVQITMCLNSIKMQRCMSVRLEMLNPISSM